MPPNWKPVSYESCKLLPSWVNDLIDRITFFKEWSNVIVSAAQAKVRELVGVEALNAGFATIYTFSLPFFFKGSQPTGVTVLVNGDFVSYVV